MTEPTDLIATEMQQPAALMEKAGDEQQRKWTELQQYWLDKIAREDKAHADFRKEGDEAEADYFDERKDLRKNLFPMFWSNVNTMHSALYSATPIPDVRARNSNAEDPQHAIKAEVSKAIERALAFATDTTDFDAPMNQAVDDYLIAGLGVPWVEYDAVVQDTEGPPDAETGKPTMVPTVALQTVKLDRVPWRRFRWEPGVRWEDSGWVARDHYLTKREIKSQFHVEPPQGASASLATTKKDKTSTDKYAAEFLVHEIWSRETRTIYVIGVDFDAPLEVRPDKLKLEKFYPCPKPLFANLKSRELTPKSDYMWYRSQCDYINVLSQRIVNLTKMVKSAGFYDSSLAELGQLSNSQDGQFVPVPNLAERMAAAGGSNGWEAVYATLPIADKVEVVQTLIQMRDTAKQVVYEITGISDIVRGATAASETATAQQIKGQWAGVRLKRRQGEVAKQVREIYRIMAEVIAEHFTPEQLYIASGMQLSEQALALMKTDVGRTFAIDVETDSTIAADEQALRQDATELLKTLSDYMSVILPQVQANVIPADLAKEMLLLVTGCWKSGKALEDQISKLPNSSQQMGQQNQALQQCQQQLAECQKQLADLQQKMAQVDQNAAAIDQAKVAQEGPLKQADTFKTLAETQAIQQRTAREAVTPIKDPNVVPFGGPR